MDKPLIIAMRLKVINVKITEIEHVLARNMRADRMRPGLLADVPANERTPRQVMIDAADSYFEAIEHGKGSIAPFADDCERHVTRRLCRGQWISDHPKRIRTWR